MELNKNLIVNISSDTFVDKISKRGFDIDSDLRKNLFLLEKTYRKNKDLGFKEITDKYNIDINDDIIK